MIRCKRCILPETYPGIKFDEKGVCQYCNEYKAIEYTGFEPFLEKMQAFLNKKKNRNKEYDCLLGFSGGRDSTYMLYLLTEKLGLKVLCYSADHGYIPEQTRFNMENAVERVNSKLVIEKHDYLKKCLKHVVSTWIHKPSIRMIETFCTGCKLGVESGTINCAKKYKIPVVIRAETPFEYPHYRFNLMRLYPKEGWFPMILGYFSSVAENPRWFMKPTYVDIQIKDFLFFYDFKKNFRRNGLLLLEPFLENVKWEEKKVMDTIQKEMGWKKNPGVKSSWRGDCAIALLKLYAYNHIMGFNDKVVGLSYLIRDGQLTREEALKRLKKEEEIPDEIIEEILKTIGMRFSDFKSAVERTKRKYSKGTILSELKKTYP